ncbi:MAG: HAD-IB family phosphatase [Zestosphaera sp.]
MYCRVKIAVFDMDGVLVKWRSSWRALHEYFGSINIVNESRDAEKFLKGELSYEEWMRRDLEAIIKFLGRPPSRDEIVRALTRYELTEGATELINFLKSANVITAILSGGVDVLAEMVGNRLGIDIILANKLVFDKNNHLAPYGIEVVNPLKKGGVLRKLSEDLRIPLSDFMYVGDSEWDFEALNVVGLPVLLSHGDVLLPEGTSYIMLNTLHDLKKLLNACFRR